MLHQPTELQSGSVTVLRARALTVKLQNLQLSSFPNEDVEESAMIVRGVIHRLESRNKAPDCDKIVFASFQACSV